jgi:hypothetical protein
MVNHLVRGALAGAAGTTALNAVTYLDMVLRGRPASSTPEDTMDRLSAATGVAVPGDEKHRPNRLSGLGALLGILTGTAVGAGYGLMHRSGRRPPGALGAVGVGVAAMVGSTVPMMITGVTDPRTWRPADWAADVVPHLAYGAVTAATYRATR